ncbi:MAG: helix-turn-helix domain-containing protein [Steroidobacteraceae bacterium]
MRVLIEMHELPLDHPVLIEGDDIDEIERQFRGWTVEVIHLGRGAMHGNGLVVPLGPLRVSVVHFGVAAVLRGTSPKGYCSLISTPFASPPVRVGSRRIDGGSCLVLGSQAPVEIYLPENCSAFILSLVAAPLTQRGTSHANDHVPVRARVEFRTLTADDDALLSRCMNLVESVRSADPPDLVASQIQHRLHELLLPAAASLITHSIPLAPESGEKAIRRLAVSRACAHIDAHLRKSITLKDLCDIAGVRARTLEYGFREFYDVGPMAYLRSVRLSRVRHDLLNQKSAAGSIAKTAQRWRFTHMGQFSRDYRILFGERPSTTLARQRLVAPRPGGVSAVQEE